MLQKLEYRIKEMPEFRGNAKHKVYYELAWKINEKIEQLSIKFYNDTPDPREFEHGGLGFTAEIAKHQSYYNWMFRDELRALDRYKSQHARVCLVVRSYYLKDDTVMDDSVANDFGYDGVRGGLAVFKGDLDYYVQADELYIYATQMLAAQQRLVDTLKDIDQKLIERGRQYKTASEILRNRP